MTKPLPLPSKKKQFTLQTLGENNRGEKVIVYGAGGMGKTTLCSLLPNPAFLSLDGGADKILHPVTGEKLKGINTTSFQETRDIFHSDVFNSAESVVIDHVTELQHLAQKYTFSTVKTQDRQTAQNIEDYGYHKGYRHWYDTMRLILSDCDRWVRAGKNVILIAQESISKATQAGIEDFVKDGPDLYHDKNVSILNAYIAWADHVFRINYSEMAVTKGKANPVKTRQICIHPDATFYAKSRTIPAKYDIVTFDKPSDDSIWRLLFVGGNK